MSSKVDMRLISLIALLFAAEVSAQANVPVRTLTTLAASRDIFGAPANVHALPGARLLVNDAKLRRVVILDSAMRVQRVVLDSVGGSSNSYGTRPEPVLPYGGSALFVDAASRALVLIHPDGTIGRNIAAPDDRGMWGVAANSQGVDSRGRVYYRGIVLRRGTENPAVGSVRLVGYAAGGPISSADSLPLIRGDLRTRKSDTIAALRNGHAKRTEQRTDDKGVVWNTSYVNPMVPGDEWALLSDGTIAIVRGHDYHVDWITPDGQVTSTPKLPFDWRRLTDEDKKRVRDSAIVAAARSDSIDEALIRASIGGATNANSVTRSGGSAAPPDMPAQIPKRNTIVVPVDSLPDYYPAVRANAARGDREGNLWILPSTSAQSDAGELVYDVVNRKGELTHRVRLPLGRFIAGFGPGGVVYLLHGDLAKGFTLERARVN